ncbi:hypothetical protein OROMI_002174 [Orobanche minor]
MYVFDVDALVMSPEGETMRMKITDEFEWCSMLNLLEVPKVYVTICRGINECSHSRSIRDASWKNNIFHAQKNKHMVADDNEIDLESSTDCDDTYDSHDDEAMDINDHNVGGCSRDLHTVPSLDTNNESNEVNNVENQKDVRQWMILRGAHQANLSCEDVVIPSEPVTNELVMGAIFRDKLTMTTVVGSHHMKNHLQTITVRSSSTRYHLLCKFGERCEFVMRASSMGKAWKINHWRAHTCEMDFRYHPRPRISSKVVAAEFLDNLTEDGYVLRPCDMQSKLLRDHGVTVNYRTALAGKNHALNQSYGDADKSFQLLPKYLAWIYEVIPSYGLKIGGRVEQERRPRMLRYRYSMANEVPEFLSKELLGVLDPSEVELTTDYWKSLQDDPETKPFAFQFEANHSKKKRKRSESEDEEELVPDVGASTSTATAKFVLPDIPIGPDREAFIKEIGDFVGEIAARRAKVEVEALLRSHEERIITSVGDYVVNRLLAMERVTAGQPTPSRASGSGLGGAAGMAGKRVAGMVEKWAAGLEGHRVRRGSPLLSGQRARKASPLLVGQRARWRNHVHDKSFSLSPIPKAK